MKILHICNDYSYSKVYKNLYQELDVLGVEQVIYHPIRSTTNVGNNTFDFKEKTSELIYSSFYLKKHHRIFFRLKINQLLKDLESRVDISKVDVSYPTTLFSDGAIAYKLYKKYKIPYILAVRNTDVNLFMQYRPDLLPLMYKILTHAKKIVFISKGLEYLFYSKIKHNFREDFIKKTVFIPNGIHQFWLDNNPTVDVVERQPKFLFIGRFDTNKNVENVIKALLLLKQKFPDTQLDLVGGGGDKDQLIKKYIDRNNWINYLGYVSDKEQLLKIFRKNDYFIMPSINETFGLVYIEALSQGLPILYTKNQGVDGLFEQNIGESTFTDEQSIYQAIVKLLNTSHFDIKSINFEQFRWSNIAKKYVEIFK